MPFNTRRRVPSEELHRTLEQVLSQHFQSPRSIRKLRRRVSAYASSCAIENLEVELDHGQQLRMVFKDLSPSSLLPTALQVRPAFLYNPRREIETYHKLLDSRRLGTPVCYGSLVCRRLGRYWLFLERVSGPLLWQMGRLEPWEQAARWLASMHTEFDMASQPSACERQSQLLCYDEDFYRIWLRRAEKHLRGRRLANPPTTHRRFEVLANRYDRVIRWLVELPPTFIHGEFYPSNVILRASRHARRVCPVDWELAAIAPGFIDLGALTAGDWAPDDRRRLVAAYRERWEPARGRRPSLKELMETVTFCQLHMAMQFLGWAPEWSPPERHAQNWLREVFRLAEQVGL